MGLHGRQWQRIPLPGRGHQGIKELLKLDLKVEFEQKCCLTFRFIIITINYFLSIIINSHRLAHQIWLINCQSTPQCSSEYIIAGGEGCHCCGRAFWCNSSHQQELPSRQGAFSKLVKLIYNSFLIICRMWPRVITLMVMTTYSGQNSDSSFKLWDSSLSITRPSTGIRACRKNNYLVKLTACRLDNL